jgi:beta-glucosidase-like glycosyl hydrolase
MRAVADLGPIGETACRAIEAGCDVLLVCATAALTLEAHAALTQRAEADPRFRARLRAACARSLAARARLPRALRAADDVSFDERLARLVPRELAARLETLTATA